MLPSVTFLRNEVWDGYTPFLPSHRFDQGSDEALPSKNCCQRVGCRIKMGNAQWSD